VSETARSINLSGLRAWQQDAIKKYFETLPQDFMTVATPGAGKTTFALKVAGELLERRLVRRIVIVAPTDHLTKQWAAAAAKFNIAIDSDYTTSKGVNTKDFNGVSLTYAAVAANPMRLRARIDATPTLVILDEVHHAGDALSWGEAVREAFESAAKRLMLTGTPFRSDINPIPFVTYVPDSTGIPRSVADHSYNYGDALADGVVRPVLFLAYAGKMRWRTRMGDEESAELGGEQAKDVTTRAWRTALNPEGRWIPQVLSAADKRLTEVRRFIPDAGALVIASDHEHAKAYADILHQITGKKPVVVLSDDPKAGKKIAKFSDSEDRWMVAVRMVSEGVDIPRLAVGVFATNTSTPLFFAQAIGRFVRARRHGETATVFLPSVPVLLSHAAELELQRDHVLGKKTTGDLWSESEALIADANRSRNHLDADFADFAVFEALDSEATFDRAVIDGAELDATLVPGSPEEEAILGLPGLLSANEVAQILQEHRHAQAKRLAKHQPEETMADQIALLRRQLQDVVRAYAAQAGTTAAIVNAELKRALGGAPTPMASAAELQKRIELVRDWSARR
jgi:superfamily II DNA or RNA helicase